MKGGVGACLLVVCLFLFSVGTSSAAEKTWYFTPGNSSDYEYDQDLITLENGLAEFITTSDWYHPDSRKRLSVDIENPNEQGLTNFQVKIDVEHKEGMSSNFSDLVFFYEGGELPCMQTSSINIGWSEFWVNIPALPGEESITIEVYFDRVGRLGGGPGMGESPSQSNCEPVSGPVDYESDLVVTFGEVEELRTSAALTLKGEEAISFKALNSIKGSCAEELSCSMPTFQFSTDAGNVWYWYAGRLGNESWEQTVLDGSSEESSPIKLSRIDPDNSTDTSVSELTEESGGFIFRVFLGPSLRGSSSLYSLTLDYDPIVPDAPAQPVLSATHNSITASWVAPDDNGEEITGYSLEYRLRGKIGWESQDLGANVTRYTITGLDPETGYEVQIRARNSIAYGNPSEISSITTKVAPVTSGGGGRSSGSFIRKGVDENQENRLSNLQDEILRLQKLLLELLKQRVAMLVGENINPVPSVSTSSRGDVLLQLYDESPNVYSLQAGLIKLNLGPASIALSEVGPTNYFGYLTLNALREYQQIHNLSDKSGVYDVATDEHLRAQLAE